MREKLLPPNYQDMQLWSDLADVVHTVLKAKIDDPQKIFPLLRDIFPYGVRPQGEDNLTDKPNTDINNPNPMTLDKDDLFPFTQEEYIKIANQLGFDFNEAVFDGSDYSIITSNIAKYWRESGTESLFDFFSYALNAIFKADVMWTEDYITFVPEGDPSIGLPVYKGGTWYPTTHVRLTYDFIKFGMYEPYRVKNLFEFIAPINLVLDKIIFDSITQLSPMTISITAYITVNYV